MTGYNPNRGQRVNLFEVISLLANRRKLIILASLVVFAVSLVWLFLTPNYYSSRAAILPGENPEVYAGLRHFTWLGAIKTPYDETSSMLFPEMLRSNHIMNDIISREYRFLYNGRETTMTLSRYFGTNNIDETRMKLNGIYQIDYDKYGNGVIYFVATTKYPGLSQGILEAALSSLEDFNRNKRRTRARGNIDFLENELRDKQAELVLAEERLAAFRAQNRNYYETTDPDLLATQARLEREISILEETQDLLETQLEENRLNAAKDIAGLKILNRPTLPDLKSAPRRLISATMLAVIAFFLCAVVVLFMEFFKDWSGMSFARLLKSITDESKMPEQILR